MAYKYAAVGFGYFFNDPSDPRDIAVSEDGYTWTTIKRTAGQVVFSNGEEIPFNTISHAEDLWFAMTEQGGTYLWYSRNLLDWFPTDVNSIDFPVAGVNQQERYSNVYYFQGEYWLGAGARSENGIDWTGGYNQGEYPVLGLGAIAYLAASKLFVQNDSGQSSNSLPGGFDGLGLTYSPDGNFYTVVLDSTSVEPTVATTYDLGQTWTTAQIPNWLGKRTHMVGTLTGGQVVLATSYNDNNALVHELAVSSDGINWTVLPSPITSNNSFSLSEGVTQSTIAHGLLNDVIIISNDYGEVYGNSDTFLQGNPWTSLSLGFDPNNTDIRLRNLADTFLPYTGDPYINVGANKPVYTVDQPQFIQATLRYEAPVQTAQNSLTLYKVAKDYRYDSDNQAFPAMPGTDEGLPFYQDIYDPDDPTQTLFSTEPGVLPYRYETVEEWGKVALFMNGEDVTFFRDAATVMEAISWQTFGNFEAASFYFPMISQYDKLAESTPTTTSGTGGGVLPNAIPWLTDDAYVEIKRIKPDNTLDTIWLGSVNGFDLDASGIGMRITAHGLLYEANHQLLPGDLIDPQIVAPRDTGLVAAEVLNSIGGRWSYAEPVATGISTVKRPDWDNALDFLRNLNSIGSPEIWIDTDYKPYVTGRPDLDPERKDNTFDIIAGQDGIEVSLQYDSTAPTTVIYGNGSLASGAKWRNVFFPSVPSQGAPDFFQPDAYPFDFPEDKIKKGMANSDTASQAGVSVLIIKLRNKAFLPPSYAIRSYFDETVEEAVRTAQEFYGLDITGEVDPVLWSRLLDISDIWDGAFIRPLYTSPLIDPSSSSYDPTVRRVEQYIDFGSNIDRFDAADVAQKIIERDMVQYTIDNVSPTIYKQRKSVTGTITMTMDPIEYGDGQPTSRWDMKPGDSIRIIPHIFSSIQDNKHDDETNTRWEAGDSGGSLVLYIKRIDWSFDGTPTATLTVSTRNLEFNELDAAQARVRVSNAERAIDQKAKKASGKTAGS